MADDPRVERETRLHDLLALFDVLHIERAHLISHDMGAITAMQLTYEHPERVRTAVELFVPPGFMRFSPRVAPGFRHLPRFIWHRPGASLRGVFSEAYVAHPMSGATVEAHLAPMRQPDIDGAVRPLTRGMILPEAMRLSRGVYRRRRLTVPTLFVFGRRDRPWTEENDGAPAAVRSGTPSASSSPTSTTQRISSPTTPPPRSANLAIDWFERRKLDAGLTNQSPAHPIRALLRVTVGEVTHAHRTFALIAASPDVDSEAVLDVDAGSPMP